jgi:hypothetical protein
MFGTPVRELAAVFAGGDVTEDFIFVAGLVERTLQNVVIICCHQQQMALGVTLASEETGQGGQELVDLGAGIISVENPAEFIVEGTVSVHDAYVFRNSRKILRGFERSPERLLEIG